MTEFLVRNSGQVNNNKELITDFDECLKATISKILERPDKLKSSLKISVMDSYVLTPFKIPKTENLRHGLFKSSLLKNADSEFMSEEKKSFYSPPKDEGVLDSFDCGWFSSDDCHRVKLARSNYEHLFGDNGIKTTSLDNTFEKFHMKVDMSNVERFANCYNNNKPVIIYQNENCIDINIYGEEISINDEGTQSSVKNNKNCLDLETLNHFSAERIQTERTYSKYDINIYGEENSINDENNQSLVKNNKDWLNLDTLNPFSNENTERTSSHSDNIQTNSFSSSTDGFYQDFDSDGSGRKNEQDFLKNLESELFTKNKQRQQDLPSIKSHHKNHKKPQSKQKYQIDTICEHIHDDLRHMELNSNMLSNKINNNHCYDLFSNTSTKTKKSESLIGTLVSPIHSNSILKQTGNIITQLQKSKQKFQFKSKLTLLKGNNTTINEHQLTTQDFVNCAEQHQPVIFKRNNVKLFPND